MKILDLFGVYFFILMLIQGLVLSLVDARNFKKNNLISSSKKAKYIGISWIIVGGMLWVTKIIFV